MKAEGVSGGAAARQSVADITLKLGLCEAPAALQSSVARIDSPLGEEVGFPVRSASAKQT
jgi:hypothetical protein